MSIANSQEVSSYSEGYSLTFVNKSYSLARCNINSTVNAVNNIQRPDFRIYKYLRILATYYSQVLISYIFLDRHNVTKSFQTNQFYINQILPCSVIVILGTI